jgi:DNA polymerase
MTTQREPAFVIDPRARAMLAEMGVRVWMPTDVAQAAPLQAKQDAASQPSEVVAVPVRREPPLRLPVMDAPPAAGASASSALTSAQYVISNLPANASEYDLVVLGEPCQGAAEQLLGNILKFLTSGTLGTSDRSVSNVAPRIFMAHMVASHNEAVSLHDQLASLPAKLVLALGPHAAKALLGSAAQAVPFSKLRGTVHPLPPLPCTVVVTYHPQQLLRQPQAKASCWQDIRLALRTLRTS